MTARSDAPRRRVAIRCDGGAQVGAGHVARCLPLAQALVARGWHAAFCGSFDGFAAWLLQGSGLEVLPATALDDGRWDAAIVDSYAFAVERLCDLARRMPVATIGEANRCPHAGVLVDPHLDRAAEAPSERLLPGPAYALVDERFQQARRDRTGSVRTALVTVGGGDAGRPLVRGAVAAVRHAFPDASVLVAGGEAGIHDDHVRALPARTRLVDLATDVDVAVSAAGNTAYELAAAGIPAVVVPIVDNQRRVAEGARRAGFALVAAGADELLPLLHELAAPGVRARMQSAGPQVVDGHGAARAAAALDERWRSDGR